MATHPKFIIKTAKDGQFHFVLTAKNGEVIIQSELYTTKAACENGIQSIKNNAPVANTGEDAKNPKFAVKEAKDGRFHFVLTAKNGEVIGQSQLYKAMSSAENGIASVQKNAPEADVEDTTQAAAA